MKILSFNFNGIFRKKNQHSSHFREMSTENNIYEVLPKIGFLFEDDSPSSIVCKPKLMPLKTVTLEKHFYLKN
ncbi:BBSome-interacting 1 isoform X2 [Brachionus plicatilis]|uniref:BBSome-interacting 1 isoform X2 n=1 Tax=Brachionus plicatilis TaxID=10195 RepID=A0A3M7QUT3_BRAPC|nr:BBSome-interacting 1 isoform X2 [Brachionus plicatilis]